MTLSWYIMHLRIYAVNLPAAVTLGGAYEVTTEAELLK